MTTDKPLLFLDVDGVLNSAESRRISVQFSPPCLRQLHRIIEEADPLVVLSSTLRLHRNERIKAHRAIGVRVMPCTPSLRGGRGTEVRAFLETVNPPAPGYVILDDEDEFLPEQKQHFVQTSSHDGLTVAMADEVIRRLLALKPQP